MTTWAPLTNAVLFLHLTQRNQSLVPAVLPPPAQHPKLLHSLQWQKTILCFNFSHHHLALSPNWFVSKWENHPKFQPQQEAIQTHTPPPKKSSTGQVRKKKYTIHKWVATKNLKIQGRKSRGWSDQNCTPVPYVSSLSLSSYPSLTPRLRPETPI